MEVNLLLNVTSEEFFDFLYESIINDIKESTNKTVTRKDIKGGYRYKKEMKNKMGRQGTATILIREFVPNKTYVAVFESNQGENIISYNVEELEENKIGVTYNEEYIASDKLKSWNFSLVNFFYKRKANKNAKNTLRRIESYIKANRIEKSGNND